MTEPTATRTVLTTEPHRDSPTAALVALSKWIDAGNVHRDPEAVTWGRLAKLTEESGEVIAAFIGATGQNPRKGVTHTTADVRDELLDVAITALGAYEHLTGHQGLALSALDSKILRVAKRAGVLPETPERPGFHQLFDPMQGRLIPICDVCGDEAAYCDGTRHRTEAPTPNVPSAPVRGVL